MSLDPQTIISALGLLGIGGGIASVVQYRLQFVAAVKQKEHELKRARYGALSILMLTRLDPANDLSRLIEHRPNIRTVGDLDKELEAELLNSILFASDSVVRALADFCRNPDRRCYASAMAAMRRDLWGTSTRITADEIATWASSDD